MSNLIDQADAYLAGLFDADGCVSIYLSKVKNTNRSVKIHACEISMTNEEVIRWILDTVGYGNIHYKVAHKDWLGTKPQWRFRVSHRKALNFAKLVLPYSIVKKDKLKQIINYYIEKDER